SFFGFDTSLDNLDKEEDLAVYTWGEDSYDGLGDVLDERGDDLNDETFGAVEPVGKDFDFSAQTLPDRLLPDATALTGKPQSHLSSSVQHAPPTRQSPIHSDNNGRIHAAPPAPESLESIWDPQVRGREYVQPGTPQAQQENWVKGHQSQHSAHKFSPFDETPSRPISQPRVRTLREIEAELRAAHNQLPGRSPVPEPQPVPRVTQQQVSTPVILPQSPYGIHPNSQQFIQREYPSPALDEAQVAISQVERMLQAQHLSDLQYRAPTPAEVLAQIGHLPGQLNQQTRVHHQPHPRHPLAEFQNGGPQGYQQPPFNGSPLDGYVAGMNNPGFLPAMMAQQFVDATQDVPHGSHLVLDPERRVALMSEATKKIMEAEIMEEKRRRRAAKISRMSKYNDLMTQSDKDFITRIQVSQLVSQDPYTEDFYAQVYSFFMRSRLGGAAANHKSIMKFANGSGVGVGVPGHRGAGRRENAMARMQAQVERIVKNAQARQKDPTQADTVNPHLQGALGKISGRAHKAAPRQVLQVDANGAAPSPSLASASAIKSQEEREKLSRAAGKLGREAMNVAESGVVTRKPPLTHRQIQVGIERLYDTVLAIEQHRRDNPQPDDVERRPIWESTHAELLEELWTRSMVMIPVETSDPHPFISLLSLHKGKRLIPRMMRLLPESKVNLLLVLFVACFHQLDVVRDAQVLDDIEGQGSALWKEVSSQTDAALMILPSVTAVLGNANLRLLAGLLNLMQGNGPAPVLQIVKSQPGIALLTAFMSRVDQLSHEDNASSPEDWALWHQAFDSFLTILQGSLTMLFPSRRLQATFLRSGYPIPNLDLADQIAWQFLAALAAIGSQPQQMALVAEVKDMILEIVQAVHNNWIPDPAEAELKLANVDILLKAIGLEHKMLLAA
ncbi:hypothetical protein FRB99_006948, partial [Tulasnella sp. 403]